MDFPSVTWPNPTQKMIIASIGGLQELHNNYVQAGSKRNSQSKFQNCIHPNLLAGEPNTHVLDIMNIPELDLLIGVVDTHLEGLEKVFSVKWVDEYLKKVNIVRKKYQGGHSLEGNQSSMFMKKLPDLANEIMAAPDDLKIEGLALLESLRCFQKVQETCFGQVLDKVELRI